MSVNYSAQVVVGCLVDGGNSFFIEQQGCEHKCPQIAKFCSECGKPTKTKVKVDILSAAEMAGLRIARPSCDVYTSFVVYKHLSAKAVGDNTIIKVECPLATYSCIRENIKAFLEPIGLWNEDNFGDWLVLECNN